LHVPGFFDKIINIDKCLLQSDPANKVWNVIICCLFMWHGDSNLHLFDFISQLGSLLQFAYVLTWTSE
jgi:hypothetical protein